MSEKRLPPTPAQRVTTAFIALDECKRNLIKLCKALSHKRIKPEIVGDIASLLNQVHCVCLSIGYFAPRLDPSDLPSVIRALEHQLKNKWGDPVFTRAVRMEILGLTRALSMPLKVKTKKAGKKRKRNGRSKRRKAM